MPILPIRNLSELGIIRDKSPYDLGLNAFSGGANVRFDTGKAQRAPVFRKVVNGLPTPDPWFCVGYRPSDGFDRVFIGAEDGRVYRYAGGVVTDVTASGFSQSAVTVPWTSAFLGDMLYINRPSHVPRYWGPASTTVQNLPNWDNTWRAVSLRSFKDFLVALNVTKGAVAYGSMVKWSDLTLAGQVPGSWDHTVTTNSAGENILAELNSPIVDGVSLRDVFLIYSETQVWLMEHSGGQEIFRFRKVFNEGGVISQNCVVEVDGKHFVFGVNDIYVTDGTSKQSISDDRVKDYVYRTMNVKMSERFFVHHNPNLNEVLFCYVSGDSDTKFKAPTRCNKAAVYNYSNNTWGFMDLPNVASLTSANLDQVMTFDAADMTFDMVGGTYYGQEDSYQSHTVAVAAALPSQGISVSKLYGLDPMDNGSLSYELDPEGYAPAYVERIGMDLDDVGGDLTGFKLLRRLYPQVTIYRNIPLQIQVGASETPSGNVKWGVKQTFNPYTDYKIDVRNSGRYLALRFFVDEPADFEVSGFDADIGPAGRR